MPETAAGHRVDVVIVGGGIAGLAAAASLMSSGLSLLVIEPQSLAGTPLRLDDSVAGFDPRVSALTPRSMDFLRGIGAWPAIEAARHAPYRHMTVWDAEGTASIEFDAAELAVPALGSIVENRLLAAALTERVRESAAVTLRSPARLAAVSELGDSLALVLDSGEQIACTLLIAADGAMSPTRTMLEFRTREWDYGQRALVATVEFSRGHEHTAWQRFLATGPLALLPLPSRDDRLCSIVWSLDEAVAPGIESLDDAAFAQALAEASEYRLGQVVGCSPRRAFPLRQRHAIDYVRDTVALVGDAAHTIHPLAGQGVNLGLADVEVLAEELQRALRLGLAPGSLAVLRRYQRRRKGDNLAMMASMEGFKRLFGGRAPALRWLRNAGLRRVNSTAALKQLLMRQAMGLDPRVPVRDALLAPGSR